IITTIICTEPNTFINVCSSQRSTDSLTNCPENIQPSPLKANIQLKATEETPYPHCTINGDAEIQRNSHQQVLRAINHGKQTFRLLNNALKSPKISLILPEERLFSGNDSVNL